MAVITGQYSNNELQVYQYLTRTMLLNTAAACGIMANIYHESRYDHLAEGDINLSGGSSFGLCQWREGRKTRLQSYCKSIKLSHRTVSGQMYYLTYELMNKYSALLDILRKVPNTAEGAYTAGANFCARFEVPAGYGSWSNGQLILGSTSISRGNFARNTYWTEYQDGATLPAGTAYATNYGARVVEIARENLHKYYKKGTAGPDTFDSSGFIYYCYNQAGYPIQRMTAASYYTEFSKTGKSVTENEIRAGDILFYDIPSSVTIDYNMSIATGEGGRIYASVSHGTVVEEREGIGTPVHILRILSDAETGQGYNSAGGYSEAVEDFTALTVRDDHAVAIEKNLSRVDAVGFDYGYLIDLTHGGEFKFYIPEFTESAGANWEDVSIIGRSVTIKAYSHTSSRAISISLDLYAGAGIYEDNNHEDIVGKLHKDANFVKSLEYPDYTNAIVRPPATVQMILGSAINLVGVVSDVQVEHLKPVDSQNRSMYIKLSFTVIQTAVNPPDYNDIRQGRYVLTSTENVSSITQTNNKTNAPNFTG